MCVCVELILLRLTQILDPNGNRKAFSQLFLSPFSELIFFLIETEFFIEALRKFQDTPRQLLSDVVNAVLGVTRKEIEFIVIV